MRQVIEAGKVEGEYWKDLWRYRELFLILIWRDIAVQYKQTFVGIIWAIIRPLLTMLAFTFVFGGVANLSSGDGAPYALMVFAGMLPWQMFATALTSSANSLVVNSNLVSKVYFPRIMVPFSSVGVAIVDFLMSFLILLVMMLLYHIVPQIQILAVIPLVLMVGLISVGPGLVLCSLNVTYRDFRIVVPFLTQFGLYISPVGFSSSIVPEKWRLLYEFNPMVGIIDGFRWAILCSTEFPARPLCITVVFSLFFLVVGLRHFRKTERFFADVI